MKYIIASDFHLKYIETAEDKKRRQKIEAFLKAQIGKIDGLILAGDIFDFWIEWKHAIIKDYFDIFYIFKQLSESGCRLIFLPGNHDFWIGSFLKEKIGFEIFPDYFAETINNKKVFISHGDCYTSNDARYHFFRRIIRTPLFLHFAQILHPTISLSIGNMISRTADNRVKSRKLSSSQEHGLFLKAKELSPEYDLIIFGHTHLPQKIEINKSIYINCGDWVNSYSYCYFDEEIIELR